MRRILIILLLSVWLIQSASADFKVISNSTSIEKEYLEGQYVRGRVTMNFTNQDNLHFESEFGEGSTLVEVIKSMNYTTSDYTCNPKSCDSGFSVISTTVAESQSVMVGDETQLLGMKITDSKSITDISDFTFGVGISAGEDCLGQLYIDLFDDGEIDFYNTNPSNSECSETAFPSHARNYGCFEESDVTSEAVIGEDVYYCQRIENLPAAPAYFVGANIAEGGEGVIEFVLFPEEGGEPLDAARIVDPSSGEVSVMIEYASVKNFSALACVWAPNGDTSISLEISEEAEEFCGQSVSLDGDADDTYDTNFPIFAQPAAHGPISDFTFEKEMYKELTNRNLLNEIEGYISSRYNNSCTDGCVIPIRIWGNSTREVIIETAKLDYKAGGGTVKSTSDLYKITDRPAKVTSKRPLSLDVEKMKFEVPDTNGYHTFTLEFDDKEIAKEKIHVNIGFDFNVLPRAALIGSTTVFTAHSAVNVSSSIWDFGDGTPAVTVSGNAATHAYNKEGEYAVKVTLLRKSMTNTTRDMNSSKQFRVLVGDAKTSANLTLKDYEGRLNSIKSTIATFPDWTRSSIEESLNLNLITSLVNTKKQEFDLKSKSANTEDEDYIAILNELLSADVPSSISVSERGALPAEIGYNSINVGHIESISNVDVPDSTQAKATILQWMQENYDVIVDFQTLSKNDEGGSAEIMKIYKITLTKKPAAVEGDAYLVIGYPKSQTVFRSPAGVTEANSGSASYIAFDGTTYPSATEFLIKGSAAPDVATLGAYVSPALTELDIGDKPIRSCWYCDEEGNFDWTKFIIGIIIIITATLVAYLFMQAWYKRYYERRLFKNPNDLYNLLNFIYNSRKAGLSDEEAKKKLKEKKWSGEQITYAFKKIDGKRTGMWEIPLFKFAENKKVKKELEKKQGGPIDTRFIKRRGL